MTGKSDDSFADSIAARLISLCVALLISIILVYNYRTDFKHMLAGASDANVSLPEVDAASDEPINPALATCLEQRIGDVDRMRDDGILTESQYGSFRSRAKELCVQQNPG